MPQAERSRSKPKAARVSSTGKALAYAYSVPTSATEAFGIRRPPPGVSVAFVAATPAAEAELKAWSPIPMERSGRILPSEPAAPAGARIDEAAFAPGARARALLKGVQIAQSDLKETGGAFDLEAVQRLLHGVSRQAVEKRVKDGSLLAVPGPSNRRRYPAVQFGQDGVVAGLRDVQAALPTRNPWVVLNFLVHPDERLGGRRPIEALQNGEVEAVVSAARSMGEPAG